LRRGRVEDLDQPRLAGAVGVGGDRHVPRGDLFG
jgi:hypothetical protein